MACFWFGLGALCGSAGITFWAVLSMSHQVRTHHRPNPPK